MSASDGGLFPDLPAEPLVAVAEVAVDAPLPHPLSYRIPSELQQQLQLGQRVRVPLGGRATTGFIVAFDEIPDSPKLKAIQDSLEPTPSLTEETLGLGLWVARYYGASPGESLSALVPAAVRHGRRQKTEIEIRVLDMPAAEQLIAEAKEAGAFDARCRVLRELLDAGTPLRRTELLKLASTSISPVETLIKRGVLARKKVPALDDPFARLSPSTDSPPDLTDDQARALDHLMPQLEACKFHGCLLHGITGSGKTEVYLRLIQRTLAMGRSAILLVPEIALTPQTVERLLARLGPTVAVLHSNLSDGDRVTQWERLKSGDVRVAVGPRSALFAPLKNLGLIILDEEHETTFKQNQSPRYHARDTALERGRRANALVLLGSATPSLETEGLVANGHITRTALPQRVAGRPLPEVRIIDMRVEKPVGPGGLLSRPLLHAMEKTLAAGEQVLLFLNRRGFSTFVCCKRCGYRAQCPHCDIQLTHYRGSDRLLCHYCAHEAPTLRKCPDCDSFELRFGGFGTEKVAEAVMALFPGREVARMDAETLRRRGAPERLFQGLKSGAIDVLVGTQSLAKGFDIPQITLVGVISADTALGIPDFRASERTFQLLCQVAGRAGRGEKPGLVFIQSYTPDHEAIRAAAEHDHDRFVRGELGHRKTLGYPPAGHLLRVVFEAEDPGQAATAATELGQTIKEHGAVVAGRLKVLGPAPCPITQIKGRHRHHLIVLARDADELTGFLESLPRRAKGSIRMLIDRDPVALL